MIFSSLVYLRKIGKEEGVMEENRILIVDDERNVRGLLRKILLEKKLLKK